jgi:hypothetical protein
MTEDLMIDQSKNVVLAYLCRIDAKVDRLAVGVREVRDRLSARFGLSHLFLRKTAPGDAVSDASEDRPAALTPALPRGRDLFKTRATHSILCVRSP